MMSIGKSVRLVWQRFSPQHQLLVAIMGWPILFYLKRAEDVFQWALLLQYALVVSLFFLASRQAGWESLGSGYLKQVWILFWGFVLYVTLTTLAHSPIFLNGIVGYIKHVQFVPLLLVCSAIGLRPDLLRRWFIPYVLVLIILLALPLALSAIGIETLEAALLYLGPGLHVPGRYVRYSFVFGNPNQFASFLACVMVFCLFSSISQLRRARVAIPVFGILLLGGYLVFMTLSRRVWLVLPVVSVFGLALQRDLRKRLWPILGASLLLALILYVLLMASVDDWNYVLGRISKLLVFSDAGDRQTGPVHQRLLLFGRVIGYLRTPGEWAFGLGAGTIGFAVRHYFDSGYSTVDGYYAILLGEHGLIGLLLYFALVLTVLMKLLRAILERRLARDRENLAIACVASSLVVLLAGLAGQSNITFPQALYLWAFLGIGLAVSMDLGAATGDEMLSREPRDCPAKGAHFNGT